MDLARYKELFVHRSDVFAKQFSDGHYEPVRYPLTDDDLQEHLDGLASYGVYVVDPKGETLENAGDAYDPIPVRTRAQTVKYAVFDLDTQDEKAFNWLVACVNRLLMGVDEGFDSVLAEWSGNKGYHVWLFFNYPVEAWRVREWIARDFIADWDTQGGGPAGKWPLEIFPKQDSVGEGGFGNLVKLPLGVHAVSGERSVLYTPNGWPPGINDVVPLDVDLLSEVERAPQSAGVGARSAQRERTDGPVTPFPCVTEILRQGVGRGVRDKAMFHLALYFYGMGLDQDLATEECLRANEHFQPPLRDSEVRTKVASAYSGRYESASCGADWLAEVCPGPCRAGLHVRRAHDGPVRWAGVGDSIELEVADVQEDATKRRVTLKHPDAQNRPTLVVPKGA